MSDFYKEALELIANWRHVYEETADPEMRAFAKAVASHGTPEMVAAVKQLIEEDEFGGYRFTRELAAIIGVEVNN